METITTAVTLPGPVPGTERANPTPASPIFSSVLAIHFSAAMEETTTGVALTLADHQALKAGQRLIRADANGRRMVIELIADFPDYAPEPRPNFADNVRHSHPYGVVGRGSQIYTVDAGFNNVLKVDVRSGAFETLASFPPTPNPRLPVGPPWPGRRVTDAGVQSELSCARGRPASVFPERGREPGHFGRLPHDFEQHGVGSPGRPPGDHRTGHRPLGHDGSGVSMLYGTGGTIYKIGFNGSGFAVVHQFAGGSEGANPVGRGWLLAGVRRDPLREHALRHNTRRRRFR